MVCTAEFAEKVWLAAKYGIEHVLVRLPGYLNAGVNEGLPGSTRAMLRVAGESTSKHVAEERLLR